MKRVKKKSHTFVEEKDGGYRLWCSACNGEDIIKPPMPMEVFILWIKVFERTHKNCGMKAEPK